MNKILNTLAVFLFFATIYELHINDLFFATVGVCSFMMLLILAVGLEIKDDRRVKNFQKSMGRTPKK
jgi:hypothetical protein